MALDEVSSRGAITKDNQLVVPLDEQQNKAYEAAQRQEIDAWQLAKPSAIERAGGMLMVPAAWAARRLVPHGLIEAVLRSADWLAQKSLLDKRLLAKAGVASSEEIRVLPLQNLDRLAAEFHRWALGYALVEGSAAGAAGLAGMAIDIPALITLTLRTVRGIGACYGYGEASVEERRFVLAVVGAAGANSPAQRVAALATLHELEEDFMQRTLKAVTDKAAQHTFGKEAALLALRDLARQLGVNLTQRKVLQAIPIVGMAVGAAVNWSFVNDAAWAARRTYQERWLNDRDRRCGSGHLDKI